ncbi:MAG: hypothetical protein PWQ10_6 [Patescibacteria group bacterium]|nr:hypothetical protein [Patescibacteria group bacterium]
MNNMNKDNKKKNKTETSNFNIIKVIKNLIKRYNLVIFIVIISVGLIFAVMTLTKIVNQTVDNTKQIVIEDTIVDQATLNSINNLKTVEENTEGQTLPSGRINPFSE